MAQKEAESAEPRCSFCSKDHLQVRKLVAGPVANICDECVGVCVDILRDAQEPTADLLKSARRETSPTWAGGPSTVQCALCGMPCPAAEALLVPAKGALCRPCVDEVDALTADAVWNLQGDEGAEQWLEADRRSRASLCRARSLSQC